jgi:hypothetical protein
MPYKFISTRLLACCFTFAIASSVPLLSPAHQDTPASAGIAGSDSRELLIAREGGGRGGGTRGGGTRTSGAARSRGGASAGRSRPSGGTGRSALQTRGGRSHPAFGASGRTQQHPSGLRAAHPVTRPGQGQAGRQMNISRPDKALQPSGQRPGIGQGQRPNQAQRPSRPNRTNEINASQNVNVEGYDGGWGYHGEDYPWGLGAAAGLTGFTLGRVLNALPANSQPVVIQGQPYYESNGMYLAPSSDGNYTVVPPPVGAIESQLPGGAKPVNIGGHTLYEVQGVYYQETIHNGQPAYMVVTP